MVIPEFILNFQSIVVPKTEGKPQARWVNVFSDEFLGGGVKNLYATETLFGDWNGELLILAQDALPASVLKSIIDFHIARGDGREAAWRHADKIKFQDKAGWKTNEKLSELISLYAPTIGAVYGSAASHMIYDDGLSSYSQDLRGYKTPELQVHLQNVLAWVISNMPNLKFIICLGQIAWDLVMRTASFKTTESFKDLRDGFKYKNLIIDSRCIAAIPAYHPAARVSNEKLKNNWDILRNLRMHKKI